MVTLYLRTSALREPKHLVCVLIGATEPLAVTPTRVVDQDVFDLFYSLVKHSSLLQRDVVDDVLHRVGRCWCVGLRTYIL